MKITINVPEMKCAKCNATAPLQPVFLYAKGVVPPQFREMLTDVVKERADVHATDNGGRTWATFADDKPTGWSKGPGQVDLCTDCSAEWAAAGQAFLAATAEVVTPTVPAPVVAAPAKNQPARPPTMSEIVAARNYDDKVPNNSLMPMTSPSSLRR